MTETEDKVKPLFWPGESLIEKARFICNIGGELSLWDVDPVLRVYGANSYGIWLESEEKIMEHIARAHLYANSETIPAIARNVEAVLVYMRMLRGAQP
jgi:hypothetical protein